MTVLVTGASGFIGRALVEALARQGGPVRAAVRQSAAASFPRGVETVRHGDLAEPIDWAPLLGGIEAVVHFAGIAHSSGVPEGLYDRINRDATAALAQAAARAGVQRFVFASSIRAQSGPTAGHVLTEEDVPRPNDAYGRSKLAAEAAVRAAGTPFTILRPVVVYGPGVKANVASLVRLAASPWPLPFAAFTSRRSLLAVENLISAIAFALHTPSAVNETYIVADSEPVTLADIVTALRAGMGRRPRLVRVPPVLFERALTLIGRGDLWERLGGALVADPGKLIAAGWQPAVATRAGLAELGRTGAQS